MFPHDACCKVCWLPTDWTLRLLPSKHVKSGNYRPTSEKPPSGWCFAGGPILACDGMLGTWSCPNGNTPQRRAHRRINSVMFNTLRYTIFILKSPQWALCELWMLYQLWPGPVVQSGVLSSIPAQSHTFVEIDCKVISTAIHLHPLIQAVLLSVTSKSMCTKNWLTA